MQSSATDRALLERLLRLVSRLQAEAEDFLDHPEQEQLWYNRGYANGVLQALDGLGYRESGKGHALPDPPDLVNTWEALSWGRAYRHGEEMGARETREVLAPQRPE